MPEVSVLVRFNPPQKVPKFMGVFVAAVPVATALAGLVSASKRSWSMDALLDLIGIVAISTIVSVLLFAEVRRQFRCEVSTSGFFTTDWSFKARSPFIATTCVQYPWEEVEDIGRSGYTMLFKTRNGKKKINLAMFKDPEGVATFAVEQWRGVNARGLVKS